MGRPEKHNADYFPHENGMRNDKKLKAVRTKFGLAGYAAYNMLLESLSEASLIRLPWSEMSIEMVAGDFGIEADTLKQMVDYFCMVDLLQKNNGHIYCRQLDCRLIPIFEKRKVDLDGLRKINSVSAPETIVSETLSQLPSRDSKVKKSKGEESRERRTTCQIPNDFKITGEMFEWGKDQGLSNSTLSKETEKFVDYWQGNGQKKANWLATWRNWIRKAIEYNPGLKKGEWDR